MPRKGLERTGKEDKLSHQTWKQTEQNSSSRAQYAGAVGESWGVKQTQWAPWGRHALDPARLLTVSHRVLVRTSHRTRTPGWSPRGNPMGPGLCRRRNVPQRESRHPERDDRAVCVCVSLSPGCSQLPHLPPGLRQEAGPRRNPRRAARVVLGPG